MKTATAYRSEFFVVHCPHCNHTYYLDVGDLLSESAEGMKIMCSQCQKMFLVGSA